MPFFSKYGKLKTGLQRLPLSESGDVHSSEEEVHWDDDPVWKAYCVLDQLDRFDNPAGSTLSFGDIPPVSWLDQYEKTVAERTLEEAKANRQVRMS